MTTFDVPLRVPDRRAFLVRRWPAVVIVLLFAIPGSIAFVDRPIADWLRDHLLPQRPLFAALTHVVDPAPVLASLMLVWVLMQIMRGRALTRVEDVLLRTALSVCAAVMIKDQLKFAFGRTWPDTWVNANPSWLVNGVYGFFPFHGGRGWEAFPSGHTTVICAVTAVLWIRWPKLRPLYALAALAVTIGLLGANFHWLSDILGGAALGTTVGLVAATLGLRKPA